MLVSHDREFIYLKTNKTAGTSVEIALERYCDDAYDEPEHFRDQKITPIGIIGARGEWANTARFYHHAPATYIRAQLGDRIWRRYLKIACVRNPFDKAVSAFWYYNPQVPRDLSGEDLRSAFRHYVLSDALPIDWPVYSIDGVICADVLVRYERLADDVAALADRLEIDRDRITLGDYKKEHRPRALAIAEHYDDASLAGVRAAYAREFETLGYAPELPLE